MEEIVLKDKFYTPEKKSAIPGITIETKLYYNPKTGDVRLTEYTITGGAPGAEVEIYNNGVWKYNPGSITDKAEKVKVHQLIQTTIKDKQKNFPSGAVIPTFVKDNAESMDQGTDNLKPVPTANSGGVVGTIKEFFKPIEITDNFTSANMKNLFKGETIKYPLNMSDEQDTLHITQYEYKAPYQDIFQKPSTDVFTKGIQRGSALKDLIGTVILPIPNGASDANSVNWGPDSSASIALAAAGNIGTVATTKFTAEAISALTNISTGFTFPESVKNAAVQGEIIKALGGSLNNPVTTAGVQAALLKAAGFDVSAETILSRGFGVVSNSNMELLFNGPMLRGFAFQYRMSPRSKDEAERVRKIIRFFKQGMAVKKANAANGAGGSSFLLATPNVFKLRYRSGSAPIEGINKFKICALTTCNINYTPEGKWAAYEGGQPVSYAMSLQFKELEPVYESDYQTKIADGPSGSESFKDNYESVTNNDIGY